MRWMLVVMIVLLSFGRPVWAAEEPAEGKSGSGAEIKKTEPEQRSGKQPVRKETTPKWPRPYRPSEEISVDSIVPFPADI
jgi:hypothetical protein